MVYFFSTSRLVLRHILKHYTSCKVLGQFQGDYLESAVCMNTTIPGCGHQWSKNSTIIGMGNLGNHTAKYQFTEVTTAGYCAWFSDSTDMFNSFNFTKKAHSFTCLVSTLTIKDVQLADLGVYMCNFSSHDSEYRYNYKGPTLDLTELVLEGSKEQKKEVLHYRKQYVGSSKELVLQCVVTGGRVTWWFNTGVSEFCSYKSCPSKYIPLEELNNSDNWRCYEFSVAYSDPYDDVSESMIGVKNLCRLDDDLISCTIDSLDYSNEQFMQLTELVDWERGYYDTFTNSDIALITSSVIVPSMLFMLIIAFSIWAGVRAGCCRRRNQYSLVTMQ